jgi:hypothetical protein
MASSGRLARRFAAATDGSTRPVTLQVTHAGLARGLNMIFSLPEVFGSKTQIIWRAITRLHAGVFVTRLAGGFHGPAMKYRTPPGDTPRLAAFGRRWRLKVNHYRRKSKASIDGRVICDHLV